MLFLVVARMMHLQARNELFSSQLHGLKRFRFAHFNKLCQNVVTFRTLSWQLIVRISLQNISTCFYKRSYYFKMAARGCQVQRGPLMNAASRVQIKVENLLCAKLLLATKPPVEINYGLDTLLLTFSYSCVEGCPIILIF
jgi:hypothetical protein